MGFLLFSFYFCSLHNFSLPRTHTHHGCMHHTLIPNWKCHWLNETPTFYKVFNIIFIYLLQLIRSLRAPEVFKFIKLPLFFSLYWIAHQWFLVNIFTIGEYPLRLWARVERKNLRLIIFSEVAMLQCCCELLPKTSFLFIKNTSRFFYAGDDIFSLHKMIQ